MEPNNSDNNRGNSIKATNLQSAASGNYFPGWEPTNYFAPNLTNSGVQQNGQNSNSLFSNFGSSGSSYTSGTKDDLTTFGPSLYSGNMIFLNDPINKQIQRPQIPRGTYYSPTQSGVLYNTTSSIVETINNQKQQQRIPYISNNESAFLSSSTGGNINPSQLFTGIGSIKRSNSNPLINNKSVSSSGSLGNSNSLDFTGSDYLLNNNGNNSVSAFNNINSNGNMMQLMTQQKNIMGDIMVNSAPSLNNASNINKQINTIGTNSTTLNLGSNQNYHTSQTQYYPKPQTQIPTYQTTPQNYFPQQIQTDTTSLGKNSLVNTSNSSPTGIGEQSNTLNPKSMINPQLLLEDLPIHQNNTNLGVPIGINLLSTSNIADNQQQIYSNYINTANFMPKSANLAQNSNDNQKISNISQNQAVIGNNEVIDPKTLLLQQQLYQNQQKIQQEQKQHQQQTLLLFQQMQMQQDINKRIKQDSTLLEKTEEEKRGNQPGIPPVFSGINPKAGDINEMFSLFLKYYSTVQDKIAKKRNDEIAFYGPGKYFKREVEYDEEKIMMLREHRKQKGIVNLRVIDASTGTNTNASDSLADGNKYQHICTEAIYKDVITAYFEKRRQRDFSKKVAYQSRHDTAVKRERVKGRFVSKSEAQSSSGDQPVSDSNTPPIENDQDSPLTIDIDYDKKIPDGFEDIEKMSDPNALRNEPIENLVTMASNIGLFQGSTESKDNILQLKKDQKPVNGKPNPENDKKINLPAGEIKLNSIFEDNLRNIFNGDKNKNDSQVSSSENSINGTHSLTNSFTNPPQNNNVNNITNNRPESSECEDCCHMNKCGGTNVPIKKRKGKRARKLTNKLDNILLEEIDNEFTEEEKFVMQNTENIKEALIASISQFTRSFSMSSNMSQSISNISLGLSQSNSTVNSPSGNISFAQFANFKSKNVPENNANNLFTDNIDDKNDNNNILNNSKKPKRSSINIFENINAEIFSNMVEINKLNKDTSDECSNGLDHSKNNDLLGDNDLSSIHSESNDMKCDIDV